MQQLVSFFQVLVISPQNLHEDVIELLGYTKLRHLHILQNRYSPKDTTIRLVMCYSVVRRYVSFLQRDVFKSQECLIHSQNDRPG